MFESAKRLSQDTINGGVHRSLTGEESERVKRTVIKKKKNPIQTNTDN